MKYFPAVDERMTRVNDNYPTDKFAMVDELASYQISKVWRPPPPTLLPRLMWLISYNGAKGWVWGKFNWNIGLIKSAGNIHLVRVERSPSNFTSSQTDLKQINMYQSKNSVSKKWSNKYNFINQIRVQRNLLCWLEYWPIVSVGDIDVHCTIVHPVYFS